ncbi:hypothetical protein ASG42_11215 [Rhizobium sp. Leaf391]|uniref:hypothetical protein n=1 Tax=Rhizobium sp. Leaf391 TaxID=1736360 RepID=UPI000712B949|nr:hypothetical protein [Rhizobium sp. Leaf391]KQS91053.1 hypothetical protein ASG42_11215 [Rhizobium sp. Leaf391]
MLKVKSKSQIFKEAWQIAKAAALRWGGSARSYLAAALRSIYADLRKTAYRALDRVYKQAAINTGVYQVMTTLNAPSDTLVDQVIATVSAAASTAVAKVSTIASKTLGFFKKVFDFATAQEVALE